MSWDLSSEEVIVDKLENQQRTIFTFSAKIKELEQKNELLRMGLHEASQAYLKCFDERKDLEQKLAMAKDMFEGAVVSLKWIVGNSTGEVSEYADGCAEIIDDTIKQLSK